jgi:hypothetical protein
MADLIRFADGVLVEVTRNPDSAAPVAGKAADRMTQAFQEAADAMGGVMRSVVGAASRALRDVGAAQAEVEFSVGFSIEGSIYVTKAKGEGTLTLKVIVEAQKP